MLCARPDPDECNAHSLWKGETWDLQTVISDGDVASVGLGLRNVHGRGRSGKVGEERVLAERTTVTVASQVTLHQTPCLIMTSQRRPDIPWRIDAK